MKGGFTVTQFFHNDWYEVVRKDVNEREAAKAFNHYTTSVAARMGITIRVIITDSGGKICAEWIRGKGVVYPPKR